MELKRHHKIMIGGLSSFLIILLITNSIFIYILYGRLQLSQNQLETEINELKAETQSKVNELTTNLLNTKSQVSSLDESINKQINLLKASASSDFSGIIGDAVKSVVTIRTDTGQGTGFIITDDGYVVTNSHVLTDASQVYAITSEQKNVPIQYIGYQKDLDVALLKLIGNYHSISLGDSTKVQVGEKVIAIGNPLGLQFSVSEGIVSAINRPGPTELEAYIQTDAALNPGNSGGPLINKNGEVIGINNFKVGSGESLGFALESNYLKQGVNQIALKAFNQTLI